METGNAVRVIALYNEDWHHSERGQTLGNIGTIDSIVDGEYYVVFDDIGGFTFAGGELELA